MIYQTITAERPFSRRMIRIMAATIRNMKRTLLSAHFRFLNLSENIGISLVISQEKKITTGVMNPGAPGRSMRLNWKRPQTNSALAGTARPRNDEV